MAVYFLGTLCRRGHEHEGTGQTLRRATTTSPLGVCPQCANLHKSKYLVNAAKGIKRTPAETYLGRPCRHGHVQDGKTRRYVKTRVCCECAKNHLNGYRSRFRESWRSPNLSTHSQH